MSPRNGSLRIGPKVVRFMTLTAAAALAAGCAATEPVEEVDDQEGAATAEPAPAKESRWAGRFASGTTRLWLYHPNPTSTRLVGGASYVENGEARHAVVAFEIDGNVARHVSCEASIANAPKMFIRQPGRCGGMPAGVLDGSYVREGDPYTGTYERDTDVSKGAGSVIEVRRSGRALVFLVRQADGKKRELTGSFDAAGYLLRLRGAGCQSAGASAVLMGGRIQINPGCEVEGTYGMK